MRSNKISVNRMVSHLFLYLILIFLTVIFALPLVWMISTSLKGINELYRPGLHLWVEDVQWGNYIEALTKFPFMLYLKNTLTVTACNVIFNCLSNSLVAYGFARLYAPGKQVLFMIMLSTMMLPGQVTMIPNYILFRNLGWLDSLYPLTVPSLCAGAFNVFLLRQFYMRMPDNLGDAAKIDGCGYFATWLRIYFPLTRPALSAIAIFSFMGSWNDFMGPLIYINTQKYKTLALGLRAFVSDNTTETNLLMAATLVVILPCIVLFFCCQKYFIQGITFTGSKS